MKNLVAKDLQRNDSTGTLETASRAARTAAEEHTQAQHHPGDVVPLGCILVEHSCRGDKRHDLEQRVSDGISDRIIVESQEYQDDGCCHQCECCVETELGVLEQTDDFSPEQCGIEHGETNAGQEHEDDGRVVDGGTVEIAGAGVMGGKSACRRDGHGIVDSIKGPHAEGKEAQRTPGCQHQVNAPQGFGAGGEAWLQLGLDGACGFGGKDFDRATDKRRQNGYREKDNSQATDPLRQGAPQQHAMRHPLDMVDGGGTGSGQSRHRLKEGVGDIADISAQQERQRAESGKGNPHDGHKQIGIAAAQCVVGAASQQSEQQSCR